MICFLCLLVSFIFRYKGFNYYISNAYTNFFSPTIVLYSICIFVLFGNLKLSRDFSGLSNYTFYIYIFHTIILNVLYKLIGNCFKFDLINELNLMVLVFFLALICAVVYDKLLNKIDKQLTVMIDHWCLWKLFS